MNSSKFKSSDLYWGVVNAIRDHGVKLDADGVTNVRVQTADNHDIEPWVVVNYMDGDKSRQLSMPFGAILELREKTKRKR